MPLLATSSGQRQFPWPSDSDGDSASDGEGGGDAVMSTQELRQDNTLSVWWAGPLGPAAEGAEGQSTAEVEAVWHGLSHTYDAMFITQTICIIKSHSGRFTL